MEQVIKEIGMFILAIILTAITMGLPVAAGLLWIECVTADIDLKKKG